MDFTCLFTYLGLPRWLSAKESACIAKDADLIPELGISLGGGNSSTLAQQIDVVWSCSPGPNLSHAGRGTGFPGELARSSQSVCWAPRLSFPLLVGEGEEDRGWV